MSMTTLTVAIVSVVLFAGLLYQFVGARRDRRTYLSGRLVDIGGLRLHTRCSGEGGPPVILEAGIAASSLSWARVQPRVAEFTHVCSYDRAGLGWSDPDPDPLSAARHAEVLRRLLQALNLSTPCVLVGHSYGTFVVRAYAERFRADVAALVLVDPIYSSEWAEPTPEVARRLRGGVLLSRLGALLARLGFVRLTLELLTGGAPRAAKGVSRAFGSEAATVLSRLVGEVRKLPPEAWPVARALWSQPRPFTAMARHLAALSGSARELVSCAPLGDLPVVVITAGSQPESCRLEHQRLSMMSAQGRQIIAPGSGHWVHLDEPDVVVDAIRQIVMAARPHPSGPPSEDASAGGRPT
jgi:pimeloyl-ACP methyl ester carboxylesterase